MISAKPELVDATLDELRTCGSGRRECVVYWLASLDDPHSVIEVVHPAHTAAPVGYVIDGAWLNQFFFKLADRRRLAVAQVHTHPGTSVDHSPTDDQFVLVPSPGFVSIVIPAFGHAFRRSAAAIHVLGPDGAWRRDESVVSW